LFFALVIIFAYPFLNLMGDGRRQSFYLAQFFCKVILFLSFVRANVFGKENVLDEQNFILAVNHSSFIDSVLLLAYFPRFFRIIAHNSGFGIPVFKQFYRALGFIRSDINMKIKDQLILYQALKRGEDVLVYSFMRKRSVKLVKFTDEIVNFSKHSGIKILPVRIDFANKLLPLGRFLLQGFRAKIEIKKPAFFENREDLSHAMQDFFD